VVASLGWANFKSGRIKIVEPQLEQAAARLPDDPSVRRPD
jgi:hypothetical protein